MKCLSLLIVFLGMVASGFADDWPTWQHDQRRSGFSSEQIDARRLAPDWSWKSNFPPQPAWHGPAKWDAYARIRDLPAMRSYDQVFHVVVVGDRAFFGSSADDSVRCLDVKTGEESWKFVTDGPVRVAPLVANGRVYFGSDDGFVYSLNSSNGILKWKFRPVEPGQRIVNNGRLIPLNPCRTGVVLNGENVWFSCGMLPWHPSWLCSVNADTGLAEGKGTFVRKLSVRTLEGAPAVSSDLVLFPQGRVAPQVFSKADGKDLGSFKKSGGGSIVVVSLDEDIFHGPATDSRRGGISRSDSKTREMVAGYGRGSALVVSDRVSYMLADDELIASDLVNRKVLFQVPCEHRLSLIGTANAVFAGGEDSVAAFDAQSGERLWQHDVDGKVYGLAIANGRLFASTDTGTIYSFRADLQAATVAAKTASSDRLAEETAADSATEESQGDAAGDSRRLGRWLFEDRYVRGKSVANLTGGRAGRTTAGAVVKTVGTRQALEFDGSGQSVVIAGNHREAKVPRKTLSAEAWVRVDEPRTWGGIVGAIQDNGDFERGWLLGYREKKFSFALAGTEGNGRLTYLTSQADFKLEEWFHVAGTYDGSKMTLYVNGEPVGVSKQQAGDIHYPPQAFYEIGAYHDKDEHHRLRGAIHEVCVYDDVLTSAEIAEHYSAKVGSFPKPVQIFALKSGPALKFTGSGTAVVRWETAEPTATKLELTPKSGRGVKSVIYEEGTPKQNHEVTLRNLKRNRIYAYVIRSVVEGKPGQTPEFECDTFFDYTVPDGAAPASLEDSNADVSETAQFVLRKAQVDRGICLVCGLVDGRLVRELCRNSQLRVVAVDDDPARVSSARETLNALYGVRVSVHYVEDLAAIPFVGHFANLVTTERPLSGGLPTTFEEAVRLLRPDGGVALFGDASVEGATGLATEKRTALAKDLHETTATKLSETVESTFVDDSTGVWAMVRTSPWSGTGDWSHLYGSTDNSAFAGESLSGVRSQEDLKVQWVGRPGPRYQADRSGRKPSPLAVGGRLFLQGLERIVALDSYNGTVLWSLEVPGFKRFNVPRDSGNWCANRDHVFAVVRDEVWQFEAATGNRVRIHKVDSIDRDGWETDWGFVARSGSLLIGSSVKSETSWTEYWGKDGWHDARTGPSTFQIGSDRLFARSVEDGSEAWGWSSGVILNSSITIADGRVYFVECRHPEIQASDKRRLGQAEAWQQQFLVSLDATTGSKLWEKPIDTVDGNVAFYMAHAKDRLVIVSSSAKVFHVSTYASDGGKKIWAQKVGWKEGKGDHGKAMSRPAIVGDKLFVRPQVLSLIDGKQLPFSMPSGHGCGTYACTTNALFLRSDNVTVWDTQTGEASAWPRLRPDCWLSTIPAGGMLLAPEGGGGCSCGSWMETSIGFMPAARR